MLLIISMVLRIYNRLAANTPAVGCQSPRGFLRRAYQRNCPVHGMPMPRIRSLNSFGQINMKYIVKQLRSLGVNNSFLIYYCSVAYFVLSLHDDDVTRLQSLGDDDTVACKVTAGDEALLGLSFPVHPYEVAVPLV